MNIQHEQTDSERLKEVLRKTGEFIAYFEIAETKMLEWKHELEQRFAQHDALVKQQLDSIYKMNAEFSDILTEAGAARWRIAAEQALKEGEKHIESLEKVGNRLIDEMQQRSTNNQQRAHQLLEKFELASHQAIEAIDQKITGSNINEFQQIADDSITKIEELSTETVGNCSRLIKSFQLKNALIAIGVATVTALTMGLYVSNEMPWEIHKHAAQEREAGKALLNAWANLNPAEKHKILQYSRRKSIG